jgi:hypothetical protein
MEGEDFWRIINNARRWPLREREIMHPFQAMSVMPTYYVTTYSYYGFRCAFMASLLYFYLVETRASMWSRTIVIAISTRRNLRKSDKAEKGGMTMTSSPVL